MYRNKPLVSIITPSFNQGKFVEETILSALNQTYLNIEYIFVDGGSNDETMHIVRKYSDIINIIVCEKDQGQADAINKGFKLAKGELVGWINSDDILYPDCVEKIVELYQNNPDGAIYYHSFNDRIDERRDHIATYQSIIPNRQHLLKKNYDVVQQGSFYNHIFLEKVNFLNIENFYCMDLDLWLKLLQHGSIFYTQDKPHSAFREYRGTKTDTGKEKFLKNIYVVLKNHGAKFYYPTIWNRIYLYYLKTKIKKFLNG